MAATKGREEKVHPDDQTQLQEALLTGARPHDIWTLRWSSRPCIAAGA